MALPRCHTKKRAFSCKKVLVQIVQVANQLPVLNIRDIGSHQNVISASEFCKHVAWVMESGYSIVDGPKNSFNSFSEVFTLSHIESFSDQLHAKEYLVLPLTIQSYLTHRGDSHRLFRGCQWCKQAD